MSMQITTIASGLFLAEGPRVDDNGTLYFGDAIGSGLFMWRDGEGQCAVAADLRNVGGCVIHKDGGVICSTRQGLACYDPASGEIQQIECSIDGDLVPINDIEAAPDGSLWGGTIDHDAFETGTTMRPGYLFRMDPTGQVTRLREIGIPNGMVFSDDGQQLFLSESGEGVFIYDVSPESQITGRRAFALLPDSDGIAMDQNGGLWIARYQTNRIEYYDVGGALQQAVEVPFDSVTSVCFGGRDLTTLYVTGGSLEKPGHGGVVRFTVEIPGREARKTSIPHIGVRS